MLKCVFMGRRNLFNQRVADWLSEHVELAGIVWTDTARRTMAWRWRWLRRSMKRHGVVRTLDCIMFRLWCIASSEMREGWQKVVDDVWAGRDPACLSKIPEQVVVSSATSVEVETILKRLQPDILFVVCISQLLTKNILSIPRLHTFIYHECLTPEYRGQHTVFWALANGDDDKVGYTLLSANSQLDGGQVYAQGRTSFDPLATSMGYSGHWALYEGLQDVARVLKEVEDGSAKPIDTSGRKDGYYSYFPLSKLWKIRKRRKDRECTVDATSVVKR